MKRSERVVALCPISFLAAFRWTWMSIWLIESQALLVGSGRRSPSLLLVQRALVLGSVGVGLRPVAILG